MNTKIMNVKKITAILLCALLLIPLAAYSVCAMPLSSGVDALRTQFSRDSGPSSGGYSIDYSYYSPVKNESDSTKYPLVIFLPGLGEGKNRGGELTNNNMAKWSSEELQARFANGGSFIMLARDPEEKLQYWDRAAVRPALKAAIDDFVRKHPNVDTGKIIICGWCLGSVGAIGMGVDYPGYFSCVVAFSLPRAVSSSDAAALRNTAVWLIGCKKDSYSLYSYTTSSWSNLRSKCTDKSKIRLTSLEDADNVNGLIAHRTWMLAEYDMASNAYGCVGVNTIDGNGNQIARESSMISWISAQSANYTCTCACHKSGITKAFWNIRVFFYRLFGVSSKRVCSCGKYHW